MPKFIAENPYDFEFGICTMPSDNMNSIMTHEYGQDFVRKMIEKHAIE